MKNTLFCNLIFFLTIAIIPHWTLASVPKTVPISPHIEILDSSWNSKEITEIINSNTWVPTYSDEGKSRLVFQGNWYRLKFGEWFQGKGDWVLVYPLSAGFKLYRLKSGTFEVSEHGYKSASDERIHYRRTAITLNAVQQGESIYFKVSGKPARSSDHPVLISPDNFITKVSQELPFSVFYYSVILVVGAIALFAFFMLKEKIFLFYALYMLSTIGVFLGIQGYAYQYTTHWDPGITIFFFGVVNFFIVIFINELFKLSTKAQRGIHYI